MENIPPENSENKKMEKIVSVCAECKKVKKDNGNKHGKWIEEEVQSDALLSHGICPDCTRKLYPDLADEALEEDSK
jgi:hypothetical protein